MTTKRTPINRDRRARMTPELLANARRLRELDRQHMDAIRGLDDTFYSDGLHQELGRLVTLVYRPLGIQPWDDPREILDDFISAA